MITPPTIGDAITGRFGSAAVFQQTCDQIPTFWVKKEQVHGVLRHLKHDVDRPYKMLYDLTAISPCSIISYPSTAMSMYVSRYHSKKLNYRCRVLRTFGQRPIGMSVKCGTCSGSSLMVIRISRAS